LKNTAKRLHSFQFVLDELDPIRPTIKQMFGFTYVYLDDKLLLALRNSAKQPNCNGVWIYTEARHLASLHREFPEVPGNRFWKSGKNGWMILARKLEGFEELALKACELILNSDSRVGRVTRGTIKRDSGLTDRPRLLTNARFKLRH
jgi:hypothetical protein